MKYKILICVIIRPNVKKDLTLMPQFFCFGVKYKSKCKETIKNPCSLFALPFALSKFCTGTFWNFLGAIFFKIEIHSMHG